MNSDEKVGFVAGFIIGLLLGGAALSIYFSIERNKMIEWCVKNNRIDVSESLAFEHRYLPPNKVVGK